MNVEKDGAEDALGARSPVPAARCGLFLTAACFLLAWPGPQAAPTSECSAPVWLRSTPYVFVSVSYALSVCVYLSCSPAFRGETILLYLLFSCIPARPWSHLAKRACRLGARQVLVTAALALDGVCVSAATPFCLSPRHTSQRSGLPEAARARRRRHLHRPGPGLLRTPPSGRASCAA